ncbi:MAG: phosphate acyltransferase PlsX [Chloroflexi bacterium]|nr:phosphate acyltransferase PlsX [Chloroflexota bacterium]
MSDGLPVALDAMGGDHAPREVLLGAAEARRRWGIPVALVGPGDTIRQAAREAGINLAALALVEAPSVVGMAEHPVQAVRAKPDSSLVVGLRLVKEGRAAAFVTAGNTGAAMAAALFELGRIAGVARPALAIVYPALRQPVLLLDVGANAECRPQHLVQFAQMGVAYAESALRRERPRVALLSNGEEPTKGSQLVLEAHRLLAASDLNFAGNVEGRHIPLGEADVVVTDGFVGNVVIKLSEGLAETLVRMLREEALRGWVSRLGALLMLPALRRMRRRVSYEEYGGSPLLGVNGVVIVAHGRSRAWAIANAVRVAHEAATGALVERLSAACAGQAIEA